MIVYSRFDLGAGGLWDVATEGGGEVSASATHAILIIVGSLVGLLSGRDVLWPNVGTHHVSARSWSHSRLPLMRLLIIAIKKLSAFGGLQYLNLWDALSLILPYPVCEPFRVLMRYFTGHTTRGVGLTRWCCLVSQRVTLPCLAMRRHGASKVTGVGKFYLLCLMGAA